MPIIVVFGLLIGGYLLAVLFTWLFGRSWGYVTLLTFLGLGVFVLGISGAGAFITHLGVGW